MTDRVGIHPRVELKRAEDKTNALLNELVAGLLQRSHALLELVKCITCSFATKHSQSSTFSCLPRPPDQPRAVTPFRVARVVL